REISRCTALVHFCGERIFSCAMTVPLLHAARPGAKAIFYIVSRALGANLGRRQAAKRVFQRPATRAIGARAASPGVVEKSPTRSSIARPPHRDLPTAR